MPVVHTQRRHAGLRALLVGIILALFFYAFWLASENPNLVLFGRALTKEPVAEKVVALTFDDGPNPPYTSDLVVWLKQHGAVATFFCVGRAVQRYPGVVRAEVAAGDEVGNHTWDHAHLLLERPSHQRSELMRTNAAIKSATGAPPTVFRPPFGGRDPAVVALAGSLGMKTVLWSVPLAGDWNRPPAETIAKRLLAAVKPGSILVLHDGNKGACGVVAHLEPTACDRSQSVEAAKIIVSQLQAQGYRFVTVDQLLKLAPSPPTEIENEQESAGGSSSI